MKPQPLSPEQQRLPVGQIKSDPIKGDFQALPLFGWVSQRAEVKTPLVMLTTLLMRSSTDPTPAGTLNIELPIFPETELATLALLEELGWDGRVWPIDDGWPTGDVNHEEMIIALMDQALLRATLTFPPNEERGARTFPVSVQRAQGPFSMPPLPELPPSWTPDERKLERLRQLCADPKVFHRPMQPAETTEAMKIRELTRLMLQTNTKKMLRQTKSQCLQFGIPFKGVEDRPEDLDRLAIFVTDGVFRAQVRRLASNWKEDEKQVLREALRVALKRHATTSDDAASEGTPSDDVASEVMLCLSCNTQPACNTTEKNETVALCEACKALVGDPRGVQFASAADEPPGT